MEIEVRLHKNAKNVDAIRRYWKLIEASPKNYPLAGLNYLAETGRMEESEVAGHRANMDKIVCMAQVDRKAVRARLADGDQTVWSQLRGERSTHGV